MRQQLCRRSESGLALVAVLGIIVLLSLLAASVLEITRRHGQLLRRSMEASQAAEIADSAIRLILRDLITQMRREDGVLPKVAHDAIIFGKPVALEVQFEAGRVDVNFADAELLSVTLAANGLSETTAFALASRILDWRDPDDVTAPAGAERSDYERAGLSVGPRNAPFESVSELRLVLGFNEVPASLLDAFTVYSHRQSVRRADAVPVVERALGRADQRTSLGQSGSTQDHGEPAEVSNRPLAGESLRVMACVRVAPEVCREAIVRLTGGVTSPVQILSWQGIYAD